MDLITFENNEFLCRELNLKDFGNVLISTSSLNSKLMNEDGEYCSFEARILDEELFYFVDDKEIILPESKLSEIILVQL